MSAIPNLTQDLALKASMKRIKTVAGPDTAKDTLARAAALVSAALQPASTVTRRIAGRISGLDLVSADAPLPDRTWVTPSFDEPLYEDLVALGSEFLCPGIGAVGDDQVGLLEVNAEFVVSFLIGANHELSRELVWREFPCRPDATFLRRFWDTGPGGAADIGTIAKRRSSNKIARDQRQLGQLATGQGDGTLVLLIRGELLRRYPDLVVYAVEAAGTVKDPVPDPAQVHEPLFTGTIDGSTRFFGFDVDAPTARGDGGGKGWFFVIEQQPTAPRFGLDVGTGHRRQHAPADTNDWSWDDVELEANAVYGDLSAGPFRSMSSAQVAQATYQRPVRFFAHARTMLPD